jgi:hypothetical protein
VVFVLLLLVLATAGVAVAATGMRRLRLAAALRDGARAQATVVATRRDWTPMLLDPLGGPASRPVVRFQPAGGAELEARAQTAPGLVRVGDTVAVRYDPAQPGRAELETWVQQGGNGILLVLGGCALAVVAALLMALVFATM